MNKIKELQDIKQMIMSAHECDTDGAVEHIATLLTRSKPTVYGYLSEGTPNIPDHTLELLKFKLIS